MWILIAEMLLALGVIVFIFWWTMRARIDHPVEPEDGESTHKTSTSDLEETRIDDKLP